MCVSTGDGAACSIVTNSIYLDPASIVTWSSVGTIATAGYTTSSGPHPPVGFLSIFSGSTPAALDGSSDFMWTDVSFQFDCSGVPDFDCGSTGYGSNMRNPSCGFGRYCYTTLSPWSATCTGGTLNAKWLLGGCGQGKCSTIDFY